MTKLTHPDSDQPIEVEDDQVAMYETQGWEASTTKGSSKK